MTTSINTQFDSTELWLGVQELCPHITVFLCNELEAVAITKSQASHVSAELDSSIPEKRTKAMVKENSAFHTESSLERETNQVALATAAAVLLRWGCAIVVITQGADGASAYFSPSLLQLKESINRADISTPSSATKRRKVESASSFSSSENAIEEKDTITHYQYSFQDTEQTSESMTEIHIESHKLESIIDTTGAGDAFTAGFLVHWCAHFPQLTKPVSSQASNTSGNDASSSSIYTDSSDSSVSEIELTDLLFRCIKSGRKTSSSAIQNIGGSTISLNDLDKFI